MASDHDSHDEVEPDSPSDAGFVSLNEEQLRILAKVLYYQEVEAIQSLPFHSEPELVEYLGDCKAGYDHVWAILDESLAVKEKSATDEEKASIANDLYSYALNALDFSLQCVRSFKLRLKYLKDIRYHTFDVFNKLERLDGTVVADVERMAKEAYDYKMSMLEYNKKYQNNLSRIVSEEIIKETSMTFDEFVLKYQSRLNLSGPFHELEETMQRQVFEEIIRANGLGDSTMTKFSAANAGLGGALLVSMAGLMVWDIYTSQNKIETLSHDGVDMFSGMIGTTTSTAAGAFVLMSTLLFMASDVSSSENKTETAAEDAVTVVSGIGGNVIGEAVESALVSGLDGFIEVSGAIAASAIGIAGFVVAIAAGYLLSKLGQSFLDWLFKKKDTRTSPPPQPLPLTTDGHRFYVAQMPDARALARQIAYHT